MAKVNSNLIRRLRRHFLAAARSRSRSDSPPDCHSILSRRFATPQGRQNQAASLSGRENKRRGFTVIELAISLAVIAIVTVATVSIINSQQRIYTKTSQTIEATNITENAIECFRYAVNNHEGSTVEESFEVAFAETGVNLVGENGNYTVHKNGLTVVIKIEGNTITAVSTDSWDKEILNESYTK